MKSEERETLRREFLAHAEAADVEARKASDRYIRESWLRIAETYRKMAEEVEP